MIVLMGGSGSTGSSLLKNILNRHPAIFAGEESNLFCKKGLYSDFNKNKSKIGQRGISGLKNHGWHIYNGVDLFTSEYNFGKRELDQFTDRSNNFRAFGNLVEWHLTQDKQKTIWIEKTPANACNFGDFLDEFPKGKVIHITRDPLDTIASLVGRGYSTYYAVGIYLINTASGLTHQQSPRSITVKYEDLVQSPKATLTSLCQYLEIPFYDYILQSHNESIEVSQLEGWNYDETQAIGKGSIGRFMKLPQQQREQIRAFASALTISRAGIKRYGTKHNTIGEIASALGYTWEQYPTKGYKFSMLKSKAKDKSQRISRSYPTGLSYPIKIK